MADVKWIKIATGMFDNRKIKQIERMPEGDAIIVVWFKLLCLAGTCNKNGMVFLTEEIPYTEDGLAIEFNMEQPQRRNVLKLAMSVFENYGMIEIIDSVYYISSWDKYQNTQALDKMREQTRNRVAKYRESQKICNVTVTQNVTQCNATDIDIEEEIEIDKDIKKEKKHKFGEFEHIRLKESESSRLIEELGQDIFDKCIKRLDEYIQETGKKYKDHNLTIRRWVIEAVKQPQKTQQPKQPEQKQSKYNQYPQRGYTAQDYADIEKGLLNKSAIGYEIGVSMDD